MKHTGHYLTIAFLGIALAGTLAACGPGNAAPVELGAEDSGSTQTISTGQELTISLDSNPTTGYRWAVDGAVPPQLEQLGEPEYAAGSNAIGAGGVETWRFVGKALGTGTLKLKYWRSFEPTAAPADVYQVEVEVR